MTDFKIEILHLLETALPEMEQRIQAGAVDERTATPFAVYTVPEETPVRTGYVTTFEITFYDNRYASVEQLRHRAIAALEGAKIDGKYCRYKSSSTEYFPDCDLHSVTLLFRIV